MKKTTTFILGLLLLVFFQTAHGQTYDYLKSATATGNGVTTNNSKAWTDLFSVTIDVTNVSYVMITASINMRPDGDHTNGREANYNIYRSDLTTDESGVIKRQIIRNGETGVQSWGIGTLVHIFNVEAPLTGNKTYTLEHSNQGQIGDGRNVYSSARLTAVALTTATSPYYQLSNDVIRLGATGSTTTSSTYAAVANTTTDSITLPIKGDIFVIASINGKATEAGTATVAEYKLESSTDGGISWADLGKAVKRSMINNYDDGIVSLTCILQDQEADNDFKFRIAHKRESGTKTVTTHNCNIVAVALAHSGGGYFPSFCSEVDATGVGVDWGDPYELVTSSTFTAASDIDIGGTPTGTSLFVSSQYLVDATNLQTTPNPDERMRAGNQLYADDGTTTLYADEYYRYIPDNSNFGAGGFIGLMTDLTDAGSYTIGMNHKVVDVSNHTSPYDEILTTSEVILTGFQTYDQPRLSGSYDIGTNGDYTSLSNADGLFADINVVGLCGNVTANIISDITETGANQLDQWTEYDGTDYTLTIQPDATTLRTLSSTSSTPVYINGADRVTIDGGSGKYLTFKCTNTTPANTEAVFFFVDGATSNTITNCNIESNVQSFVTKPINAAIEIVASGGTDGGDNEVTISNCNIYNSGASDPLGCGIYINSWNTSGFKNTVTISNNNIYNFAATTATNVACGIYVYDEDADDGNPTSTTTSITGNSFYCNLGTAPTSNQTAILIDGGISHTITGNYIGGQSASCGGGSAWSNTGDDYLIGIEIRYGPTGTTYDVSSNTMQNISTTANCWGYYNHEASVDFSSNTIGHASSANSIITSASGFTGVYLDDNNSSSYVNTIEDNIIANIQTNSTEYTFNNGIYINAESDIDILKNKIYNIGPPNNSSPGSEINGIYLAVSAGSSTYTLVNNVVSLGTGIETNSQWVSVYLDILIGATVNLYYNSLFLAGSSNDDANQWTGCVYRANSCTFVSKNNIIYNLRSDAAYDDEVYDFGSTGNVTSNNNILYAPNGVIAYYNSTTYTTLLNWQGAINQDANSADDDPQFTNSSGNPPDLSLLATNEKGTYLSSYLTDIDGTTRSATSPDAGAYEYWAASWTGSTDTDWNTAGNWSTSSVPTSSINVKIPNVANDPIIAATTSASCDSLAVVSGATLTINSTSETASGSLIVSGTATGNVTYERWMEDSTWHIVSAPVETQTINGVLDNTSGANSIAFREGGSEVDTFAVTNYVEATNSWGTYYTGATTGVDFTSGVGYLMRRQSANGIVSFTGTVADADFGVTLAKTGYAWNALGNPFTSAMNANNTADGTNNLIKVNTSVLDDSYVALYIWDETASYDGSQNYYKVINQAGGAMPGGETALSQDHIQAGQGFIVKAKTNNVTFSFTRAMQTHQTTTPFKSGEISDWADIDIFVANSEISTKTKLKFNDEMTDGLDVGYDAGVLKGNPDFSLFTQLAEDNGVEFMLQCLPIQNLETLEIPIGLDATTAGEITLSIEKDNFPETVIPVLNDKLLNTQFAFNSDGDVYTTTVNDNTKGFGRFTLTFSSTTDAENIAIEKQHFKAWFSNGKINLYGKTTGREIVRVYNISGQEISNTRLENTNLNTIELPVKLSGIYLIRIEKQNGMEVLKVPVLFDY